MSRLKIQGGWSLWGSKLIEKLVHFWCGRVFIEKVIYCLKRCGRVFVKKVIHCLKRSGRVFIEKVVHCLKRCRRVNETLVHCLKVRRGRGLIERENHKNVKLPYQDG